jgi:hypothetical protein
MSSKPIYTKKYDFPPVKKGDTWLGSTWKINQDITGWEIRMWLVAPNATKPVKELTIGNGITIIDAAEGVFAFNSFIADLPAVCYRYDVQFTTLTGIKRTYAKGLFTVYDDITK